MYSRVLFHYLTCHECVFTGIFLLIKVIFKLTVTVFRCQFKINELEQMFSPTIFILLIKGTIFLFNVWTWRSLSCNWCEKFNLLICLSLSNTFIYISHMCLCIKVRLCRERIVPVYCYIVTQGTIETFSHMCVFEWVFEGRHMIWYWSHV